MRFDLFQAISNIVWDYTLAFHTFWKDDRRPRNMACCSVHRTEPSFSRLSCAPGGHKVPAFSHRIVPAGTCRMGFAPGFLKTHTAQLLTIHNFISVETEENKSSSIP